MMAVNPASTIQQLQVIQQQLMNHVQQQQEQRPQPIKIERPQQPAIAASAKQVHPPAPNVRTLVQLGKDLHHIRTTLNTQRM